MYIHIICAFFRLKEHSSTSTLGLGCTVNRHKRILKQFQSQYTTRSYLHGAQRGAVIHDIGENMTDENLPRLRATRAGNKGVVTKLLTEAEGILHGPYQLEEKTRNRENYCGLQGGGYRRGN